MVSTCATKNGRKKMMSSNITMHLLPLTVIAAYIGGALYLWYKNVKGR
jgi:hypothetical protein